METTIDSAEMWTADNGGRLGMVDFDDPEFGPLRYGPVEIPDDMTRESLVAAALDAVGDPIKRLQRKHGLTFIRTTEGGEYSHPKHDVCCEVSTTDRAADYDRLRDWLVSMGLERVKD